VVRGILLEVACSLEKIGKIQGQGKVRKFGIDQGKVRKFGICQGNVREFYFS